MWMIQIGVLVIWLTARLVAKGKEEKDTKRLEIKRQRAVVSCFKMQSILSQAVPPR